MTHEFAAFHDESSNQKVAKAGGIWWAGHIARMSYNIPLDLVVMNVNFTISSLVAPVDHMHIYMH